jgi:hypothetical protein
VHMLVDYKLYDKNARWKSEDISYSNCKE